VVHEAELQRLVLFRTPDRLAREVQAGDVEAVRRERACVAAGSAAQVQHPRVGRGGQPRHEPVHERRGLVIVAAGVQTMVVGRVEPGFEPRRR